MKTIQLVPLYQTLLSNTTNVDEMGGDNKVILTKFLIEIKPLVDELTNALSIAQEKLKGDNHKEIMDKYHMWEVINDDAKREVTDYLNKYNKDVENAVHDIAQRDVEIKNTLSEKAFWKFIETNKFNVATNMELAECLMDKGANVTQNININYEKNKNKK